VCRYARSSSRTRRKTASPLLLRAIRVGRVVEAMMNADGLAGRYWAASQERQALNHGFGQTVPDCNWQVTIVPPSSWRSTRNVPPIIFAR
jgi:hypothetical protein